MHVGGAAREKIFEGSIWIDLAVWETGPYDKVKCSIQGGSGMVAYT